MEDPPFWRCIYMYVYIYIYIYLCFLIGSGGCSLLCLLDGRMDVFPSKGFKSHANHFETNSDSPSSEPKWLFGAAGSPKWWWVLCVFHKQSNPPNRKKSAFTNCFDAGALVERKNCWIISWKAVDANFERLVVGFDRTPSLLHWWTSSRTTCDG